MSEINCENVCLVEIGGDGCANCLAVLPEAREIAKENGIAFRRIDIGDTPQAVEEYGVEKIPTIALTDGGKVFAKCSGYQPREILSLWVEAKIEEYKASCSE